ncbi:MAG: DUF5119 domain-containing protein [Rikenellaceae bacterium]
MRWITLIIYMSLAFSSCHRRPLTYAYSTTVEVVINADWSNLSETPTGMSVYCYPESGEAPTVTIANINSTESSISVNLSAGNYTVLVFNQIPSDFGTILFSGMDSYETAEINAVSTTSSWAESKESSSLIRDPEELAAATYLDLEVPEEVVNEFNQLRSSEEDLSPEALIYKTIDVTPKVVIKNTRVRVRITGIYNYRSARATLYGMASGYNFSEQASHSTMSTHVMESWSSTVYEEDYREGEIVTVFSCFGLPAQSTATRSTDYSNWPGQMDIDILLVDNSTIVSESVSLCDKITTSSDGDSKSEDSDVDVNLDVSVDINIDSGYGLDDDDDDTPIVLPDVLPEGGSTSGFDADVEDWGEEEGYDLQI